MKKILKMQDLACANCASRMEGAIAKLPGVQSVGVSFMSQKMMLEVEEAQMEAILPEIVKICKKIEPGCRVLV